MSNNNSQNETFEERCAAYVLDTLEADERRAFESQLEEANQDELRIYREFKAAADHLAFTVDRAEPPAAVLERIMEQISDKSSGAVAPVETQRTAKEKKDGFSRSTMAIAAAFALLLISLALAFLSFDQYSTINDQEVTITELETQLQQAKPTWKVVFGHHPLYSSGSHGSSPQLINKLSPLFSRYGVQLYLNGHDHNYERTESINGTTYVTSGNGAKLKDVGESDWTAYSVSRLGFAAVEVYTDRLEIMGIGTNGEIFDRGTISQSLSS